MQQPHLPREARAVSADDQIHLHGESLLQRLASVPDRQCAPLQRAILGGFAKIDSANHLHLMGCEYPLKNQFHDLDGLYMYYTLRIN